jgi:hypothetical protein
LARGARVSGLRFAPFQRCNSQILTPSLWSRIINIRICFEETEFEFAETGSHVCHWKQNRHRQLRPDILDVADGPNFQQLVKQCLRLAFQPLNGPRILHIGCRQSFVDE